MCKCRLSVLFIFVLLPLHFTALCSNFVFSSHYFIPESKKEGESMLDINLFREEKGNNPEIIRESQRRRFANVEIVDEIIHLDKEWRQRKLHFAFD